MHFPCVCVCVCVPVSFHPQNSDIKIQVAFILTTASSNNQFCLFFEIWKESDNKIMGK